MLVLLFLLSIWIERNNSIKNFDALFGGRLEKGYPSAGYLIINTQNGLKTCGFSVLSPTVAITASHCLDDAISVVMGLGDFSYAQNNKIVVNSAVQKAGWVNNKNRRDDFAILRFNYTNYFTEFADVDKVEMGCNYRVVAYGRTENIEEFGKFPRKSAKICTFSIEPEIFKIRADSSERSGICFGDSGSPIYIENTNKVVGIVVSILNENKYNSDPCDFNNTAIAVRTDYNVTFVNQTFQMSTNQTVNKELSNDLLVQVVDQSVFASLGLSFMDNLSSEQKVIAISIFLLGIFLIIFGIYNWLINSRSNTII
ncbi:MAG: S1 family peptidase [Candidatus Dojkabacteria bacterium]|nr:S1 family peptidase [Candidatus Dojkabacteria bacterium]